MLLQNRICKLMILYIFFYLINATNSAIEDNKRGGHGLFHGLNEAHDKKYVQKNSQIEESLSNPPLNSPQKAKTGDSVIITAVPNNRNNLMQNSNAGLTHSAIFLQPEPRGLQYMLNTEDINPFLANYMRKRDVNDKNSVMHLQSQNEKFCNDKTMICSLRKRRQTNLYPGNVIPGSRGQAVLYGVPNSQSGQGQAVLYGIPNVQSGQFPNFQPDGHTNRNSQVPFPGQQNYPGNQNFNGYQTHGYR